MKEFDLINYLGRECIMKFIKFVFGPALFVLIFLLLISHDPNVCYSFYLTKTDQAPGLQANPIIKIEYNMSPGRVGFVNGKWREYKQGTATIKKSIEDRIRKAGYKIIASGSDYEYMLKIKYFERVSSVPQWGDMVYIFSYVLEQRNGGMIMNSGEEETYRWGMKENFNYAFIDKLVDCAIKGKDAFPLYKSLLAERRFVDRIIGLLPEYKDARAIELLVPFLRDTSDRTRRLTRSSLTSLGYKPESEKEEVAMAIVEAAVSWNSDQPQQVVFEYGMPAIELYLEDLKIGYGRPIDEVIHQKAARALQEAKASTNNEWNEYVITKMIEVLETQGEGLKNYIAYSDDANKIKTAKLFYMVDAINILAEIGDQRVVEVLKGYVDHPSVGKIVFRNERGEQGKLIVDRINYLEKKLKQKPPERH
jgi:hypothetical protein